jgi:hypothetical protein
LFLLIVLKCTPLVTIRMLWDRIRECQHIGNAGGEPISDDTGVFSTHTHGWSQTYPLQAAWNIDTFKEFFNHTDKERKKTTTTKDAGYHGANAATKTAPTTIIVGLTEAASTRIIQVLSACTQRRATRRKRRG